jgi:hypothetical protein
LIGGVVPILPSAWLAGLPSWFVSLAMVLGIGIILIDLIMVLDGVDRFMNKEK